MIYTMENTFDAGKPVKRVTDADGKEYKYTRYVDTDTGKIIKLAQEENGSFKINEEEGEVIEEEVWAKPPITVEFHNEGDTD